MKIKETTIKELKEGNQVLISIFKIAIRMKEEQEKNRESDAMEARFKDCF